MPAPCADPSITRKAALPELPGWRCAKPRLVGDPGALDSGLRAGSCAAWLIFAVTHRRETKPLRRPPGFAQPESRGAGILPSFVSGGRSAPPRLADRQPAPGSSSGSASQPLPSFPLPFAPTPPPQPPPRVEPALTRSHDVIRWKSAMLGDSSARCARGHAARAEAERARGAPGALPPRLPDLRIVTGAGGGMFCRKVAPRVCAAGWGQSPGQNVRVLLQRLLSLV